MATTNTNADPGKGSALNNHEPGDRSTAASPDNLIQIAVYTDHMSPTPTSKSVTWRALVETLTDHKVTSCGVGNCAGKECPDKYGAAWSPVVIDGARSNANVREMTAIVFDLDNVTDQTCINRIELDGIAAVLHSTHSHRADHVCLRLVMPISRSVAPPDWPRFWSAVIARYGIPADPSRKDLSGLYFAPSAPTGAPVVARAFPGTRVLDVDQILGAAAPVVETAPRIAVSNDNTIAEGGRNTAMVKVAGHMRSIGLDSDVIAAALHELNQRRCTPPLPESEIDSIAQSIGRYVPAMDVAGTASEIAQIGEALANTTTTRAPKSYGIDAAEFLAMDFGQGDPWIIQGLIPEAMPTLIVGPPKAGKSWIELYLAVCIAAGISAFGRPTRRSRVLVIACEDSPGETQRRIRAIVRGLRLDGEQLRGWLSVDSTNTLFFDRASDVDALGASMAEFKPGVVFVDSLSRIHNANENDRSEMSRVMNVWSVLCKEHSCSVVLLHHMVKMGEGRTLIQKIRGTGDIGALLRVAIGVERIDEATSEIQVDGNLADMSNPFRVRFTDLDKSGGRIVPGIAAERHAVSLSVVVGESAQGKPKALGSDEVGRLADALLRAVGPMTATEIRVAVRGGKDEADGARRTMVEAGLVEQVFKGKKSEGYQLTAEGRAFATGGNAPARPDTRTPDELMSAILSDG